MDKFNAVSKPPEGYPNWIINEVARLLKEQDRDTRHACADAVNRLALDLDAICAAHSACMNVKAV